MALLFWPAALAVGIVVGWVGEAAVEQCAKDIALTRIRE
jgi:hypothetical protein